MLSTRMRLSAATGALFLALTGCSASEPEDAEGAPQIEVAGSRAKEYSSLDDLAASASAIILAAPTGKSLDVSLPAEQGGTKESAPTPYVVMEVLEVLRGSLNAQTIELVSPGDDVRTGERSLLTGGPYVLFITPAMYAADEPAGGYVVVGGPAGVYAKAGSTYVRVDDASPRLPSTIDVQRTKWPAITKSEEALLHAGPG